MEKIKLSAETFDGVMAMLNSNDNESVVLALNCIEEFDITTGITYLLLIKKLANVSADAWYEYAPNKSVYLKNMSVSIDKPISYREILMILQKLKVPINDLQFFLDKFALYMAEGIREDYAIIDTIEIKINLKLNE